MNSALNMGGRKLQRGFALALCMAAFFPALFGKDAESWDFTFPAGQWELGHEQTDGRMTIREYIPKGENISHWSALVTSFRATGSVGLKEWVATVQQQSAKAFRSLQYVILSETDTEIIVESSHDGGDDGVGHHVIQKYAKAAGEMLTLTYDVSSRKMAPDEHKVWLDTITRAKLTEKKSPASPTAAHEAERSGWSTREQVDSDGRKQTAPPAVAPKVTAYLDRASAAAGHALETVSGDQQFYLCDVEEAGGSAKGTLRLLRQARTSKAAVAFACPRLDATANLLRAACRDSKDERFDGVVLIIVGPETKPELFDAWLTKKGFRVLHANYEKAD